jgi:hypothetical protein
MTTHQIKVAIQEGWLEQEFYAELSQFSEDTPPEDVSDYIESFVEHLLGLESVGDIIGVEYAVKDGHLTAKNLGDISLP